MAYYSNLDKEDEKDTAQGMNGTDSAETPFQLSAQTSTVSQGQAGANAPKSTAVKSNASGSGPGFQNYTQANQGKAQDRLNSAVATNVTNQGNVATNAINSATNQFGTKVDAGSLANRENAVQDVANVVNSARNVTAPAANAQTPAAVDGTKSNGQTAVAPVLGVTGGSAAVPTPTASAPNALSGIAKNEQDRFKEVINARYQGPESLRQAGLYQLASGKVDTAQNTLNNTKTATGREELLKNMYQNRGDYTSGLNKLDSALLNASEIGVSNLQKAAAAQGNVEQKLDKAQVNSANLAQNRTSEIKDIQEQARKTFTEGKKAEEAATDARLAAVVKDWDKLPEYFRDIIRNKDATNKTILNEQIAEYNSKNSSVNDAQLRDLANKMTSAKIQASMIGSVNDAGSYQRNATRDAMGNYTESQAQFSNRMKQEALAREAQAKQAYESALAQKNNYDAGLQSLKDNFNSDAVNFSSAEAAMLGINSGEGIYNLGENLIKTEAYDKNKLISRDEQARQAALSQLAGLDLSNRLDTNLLYDKSDLAGTQSSLDALDLSGIRRLLDSSEQNFNTTADQTDLTGTGTKKVSRGNALGKKTKSYSASVGGNVGDFLDQAGYTSNGMTGPNSVANGEALMRAALNSSNTDRSMDNGSSVIGGAAQGAGAGAAIGSVVPGLGTGIGAAAGGVIGGVANAGTLDAFQVSGDVLGELGLGGVYKPIQDVRNAAGNLVGGVGGDLGKGIQGVVSGIDTGAMKQFGDAKAKELAIADLQNQYKAFLDAQGFANRANISNNQTVVSRNDALKQLLASLDKTNS